MHNIKDTKPSNIHIMAQNFGPIEKAEITLRPLTIFVGESNTGKTYLSTLIFALHRAFGGQHNGTQLDVFTAELERCFGVASVSELIRFSGNSCDKMKIVLRCSDNVFHLHVSERGVTSNRDAPAALGICAEKGQSGVYYLPAGRRGIMQAHELIAAAGQRHLLPMENSGVLTEFLKPIAGYQEGNGVSNQMQRIAAALEAEVLRGAIEPKHPVPGAVAMERVEFQYRPRQAVRGLRLSQASSMVSELAPLVLFLRSVVRPGDLLIIEEPEAHLHPADQDKLALTFARLIRAGVRVVITTHSDWCLQRLGILIREGEVMKLRKSVTEPVDWLVKEEVGTWWFRRNKPVVEIPFHRANGIEPQDYEDVAGTLYDNAVELQEQLMQAEDAERGSR